MIAGCTTFRYGNTPFAGKWLAGILFVLLWFGGMAYGQVTSGFTATPSSGCSPLVVSFSDASTGTPTSWLWDFGNGNTSTLQNPSATYLNPGLYDVTLIVSDAFGSDTLLLPGFITVHPDPIADFSFSAPAGCEDWTVNFTDLSSPGGGALNGWLWDFGDGTTSNQQNPTHTYTTGGTYTVSLQVFDANNCTNTMVQSNIITVFPKPSATFAGSPLAACDTPLTVNFNYIGSGAVNFQWYFGDGGTSSLQNPTHTYTSAGSFDVTLEVISADGCRDTVTVLNYVNISGSNAGFTVLPPFCEGDTLIFQDTTLPTPVAWQWQFGNGAIDSVQNPEVPFGTPGTYDVTMMIEYPSGCRDTIDRPGYVTVYPYALAQFSGDTTNSCFSPHTVNFTNTVEPGITYQWNFGDGSTGTGANPSHTYNSPGIYTVTMIAQSPNGCHDTLEIIDYIRIGEPQIGAAGDTIVGCAPLQVDFISYALFTTSPFVSYFWDLGNGVTSTSPNPSTVYTNPGVYNVTLIAVNAEGCADTLNLVSYIQAGILPTAAFSAQPNPACAAEAVVFSDSSLNVNGWYWDFGDGNFSGFQNPAHEYTDTGTFVVTLVANNNGCRDTIRDTVRILPPIADFEWTPQPVCALGDTTRFFSTSIGADSLWWDFGPGGTSNAHDTVQIYNSAGIYQVTLIAWNFTTGCADTITKSVIVTVPIVDFATPDTAGCAPLTSVFSDSSVASIASWAWNFGDGTSSTLPNPTHTYTAPGYYTVSLTIVTSFGCVITEQKPSYVVASGIYPNINPQPNPACLTDTVDFNNTSTSLDSIISYDWVFGDGSTSTQPNPSHAYPSAGTYFVSLIMEDSYGCRDTVRDTMVVTPTQVSIAFDTIFCIGDTVQFTNNSINIDRYLWDFGDGNSTNSVFAPAHYYDTLGTYPMVFAASDTLGCADTIAQNIHIVDPVPGFSAAPTTGSCPPLLVQFTDSSSWDVIGWQWDFGDGGTSALQNPSHNYILPGSYDVTLIVTSAGGCQDTIFYPNLIQIGGPTGNYTVQPDSGCGSVTSFFQAFTSGVTSISWDFGNGTILPGNDTITYTYNSPGIYYPAVILEDSFGCQIAYSGDTIEVFPVPAVNFSASANQICGLSDTVQFTDLTAPSGLVTSWQWDFGDGSTSTQQNPSHFYATTGSYTVSLAVETADGCTDTLIQPNFIQIYANPVAAYADSIPPGPGPKPVYFQDQSTGVVPLVSWSWTFGDGATAGTQNPSHVYGTCGSYPITLMIEDANGCRDTTQGIISPYPTPVVDAGTNVSFCEGTGGAQLQALLTNPGSPPYYYTWWCDSSYTFCGLDSIYDDDPIALPDSSTWYYVQVTDNVGCQSNLDSVWVEVLPRPVVNAGPDVYICPDSAPGATLNPMISGASGPYSLTWSPGVGLNDSTLLNPYARPDTTTIYTLIATGANGCESDPNTVDSLSTVIVHVKPQPIAEAGPVRDICLGEGILLQGFGYGAGPAYDFEWSPATGLNDSTLANPYAAPSSTVEYVLTVWSNGCPGTDTVTVNVHTNPTAAAGPRTDICLGESTVLYGSAAGDSTATYTYSWSPSTSLNDPNAQNPVATPDTTTTYYLVATSQYGCESPADSVEITVKPTPIAEAGPQLTVCLGGSGQLNGGYYYTTTPAADPSQVYFSWLPGAGSLSDTTIGNPWVTPSQTGYYFLQVRHNTCLTTDSVLVTVIPELGGWVSVDTPITCEGSSVQLNSGGGIGNAQYVWSPTAGLSDPMIPNPVATPDTSTTYTLTLSEAGCTETYSVPVEVIPAPDLSVISSPPQGCADLTVSFLDNSENVIFRTWDFGEGTISNAENPTFTYTQPGTYYVMLTGVNTGGCMSEDTAITVIVADPGAADFSSDPPAPAELVLPGAAVQFTDQSVGAVNWDWDFGDARSAVVPNPSHTYRLPGEYYVTLHILTAEGCRSSVTKGPYLVTDPTLFIPNVFSPNEDEIQDEFKVEYSGNESFIMKIFDRWGALIYETKNREDSWDGRNSEGQSVPEGVYFYLVEIGGKGYVGDVTLLR